MGMIRVQITDLYSQKTFRLKPIEEAELPEALIEIAGHIATHGFEKIWDSMAQKLGYSIAALEES